MTNRYLLGLGISIAASILTVAIKSGLTKYPGWGDFLLLYGAIAVTQSSSIAVLYVAKALLAVLLFSMCYATFRSREPIGLYSALALTILLLIAMSLGETVVA